jgi:hypothetical protein
LFIPLREGAPRFILLARARGAFSYLSIPRSRGFYIRARGRKKFFLLEKKNCFNAGRMELYGLIASIPLSFSLISNQRELLTCNAADMEPLQQQLAFSPSKGHRPSQSSIIIRRQVDPALPRKFGAAVT